MEESLDFIPLLLVLFLAFIVPLSLSRFRRLPVVVGEILVGILIGRSGLALVSGNEFTLRLLSEIGFAFLMFLSGLEIDFSLLLRARTSGQKQRLSPLSTAFFSFLVAILLAIATGWGLVQVGLARDPWMMALILSTTSLGIVVPVLKERGLTAERFGQTLLLAALMADFFTMFLITIYVAIRSQGLSLEILLIGVLFVVFVLTYRLANRQLRRPRVRQVIEELAGATTQVKVRGAIALLMAFVVLAELLGVELILGAFLAGSVISLLGPRQESDLRHKLDALGFGFFIPLFFISVGIRFDLQAFLSDRSAWLLAPLMLVAAYLLKMAGALVFRFEYSWRDTLASGILLSARLSLIIAASAIGLRLGAISQSTNAAIILVAALTSTLSPLLFNTLMPASSSKAHRSMVLLGAYDLGLRVARILQKHGEPVRLLQTDSEQVETARRVGFEVEQAGSIEEGVRGLEKNAVQAVLALFPEDENNLRTCRAALGQGIDHVVAIVNDPSRLPEYRGLGVSAFTPALYQPDMLALLARSPHILTLLTDTTDEQDVREIFLRNSQCDGEPLRALGLPDSLLVLSIGRDGELIIPHGNTRLQKNDRLTMIGNLEELMEAAVWMESDGL